MKKVLHLNLYRKYFDAILNGEKTIEYREITPYWSKRLEGRHYDLIQFRNGYAKVAPVMIVEFKGMYTSGHEYAIVLGKILETKNVT
jgi:ASC-1-like (ASCH) protein